MTRRGFTMLETVLAVAVGSLVVAAALGVMSTIRTSDRALDNHSRSMNELARTHLAVREAIERLHVAPPDTVRAGLAERSEEEITAVFNTAFPDPIPGVGARLEMTTGDNPRLELVLSRPLLDRPRPADSTNETSEPGSLAVITAEQLPGHRGAFELRREDDADWPTLWWVPLPPSDMPLGVVFDPGSLPPPRRLCRDVRRLVWTAFIDSGRVPLVRAVEASQLPAYIELEIETAGGGYGNWMFEIGWTIGPELEAPPELAETNADGDPSGLSPNGEETGTEEQGDPGVFNPRTGRFEPEPQG